MNGRGPPLMESARRLIASFVCLLMTGGCVSIPNVDDLLNNTAPSRRPTGVDTEGQLSVGATKTALAGLEREVGPADILRKQLAESEAITGSPLVVGNAVRLFSDGPSTYAAMFQAIERAKDHINLETYHF